MTQLTHNIYLVCTRHEELGQCNIHELYKIIENIQPEVIFEEISPQSLERFYIDKARKNLETNTIYRYSKEHDIKHIPVDTNPIPSQEFFRDYQYMMERIERLRNIDGSTFCNLVDGIKYNASLKGFKFLNSDVCSDAYERMFISIENGVQTINRENFFKTSKIWKETNEARENAMLQNIYEYSQTNQYSSAIFMIGAGHRKSILKKISTIQKSTPFKLNWIYQLE